MEKDVKPDIRYLNDIREMFIQAPADENPPLYYMYRGIKQENGLRYDITVIPPLMFGDEFNKTKGHYHSSNHSELYIVLKGGALFLMQKGEDEITDAYYVKAEAGESVIIPKGYAHFTINPSQNTTLEMANWISSECVSDYKPVENKKGACYYFTTKGWIKNNNYKKVPELREEEPIKQEPQELSFLR